MSLDMSFSVTKFTLICIGKFVYGNHKHLNFDTTIDP